MNLYLLLKLISKLWSKFIMKSPASLLLRRLKLYPFVSRWKVFFLGNVRHSFAQSLNWCDLLEYVISASNFILVDIFLEFPDIFICICQRWLPWEEGCFVAVGISQLGQIGVGVHWGWGRWGCLLRSLTCKAKHWLLRLSTKQAATS